MLQGPAGPYFRDLARALIQEGAEVTRLVFNKGDAHYSDTENSIPVTATIDNFDHQLRLLVETGTDIIVLFGSERPAHQIARQIATEKGIPLISFEEGYIRPGNITLELGGNNASSPIAQAFPKQPLDQTPPEKADQNYHGFWPMVAHGACYYIRREIFSSDQERGFFHRQTPLVREAFCWSRNVVRKALEMPHQNRLVEHLIRDFKDEFYIVPLQVPSDANIKQASNGWDTPRLVRETIRSFAEEAPRTSRLIFKIHPMARGHARECQLIYNLADKHCVRSRTIVLHCGSMGELAKHARGMLTINSSSGLSAIHHGTPLLVTGQSIFSHRELATLAQDGEDFDRFWTGGHVANQGLRHGFLNHIRKTALFPGDFYARSGRRAATQNASREILRIAFENRAPHT